MYDILQIDEKIIRNNLINLKQVVFEVTEKCNLNCRYCGLSDQLYLRSNERKNRDLPFNKVKLLIDYLLSLWKDNKISDTNFQLVVSFYGGEPLINIPLIRKIIDYIEKSDIEGKKIQYSMTTNAILLEKHIDFLVEKKFNLLISLDGDERAQSYRVDQSGNNSFNKVTHNVKSVMHKNIEYFNQSVNFISVLHNRNDVEPILHFFKTNFSKVPKIILLNASGISEDKKEEFRGMFQNMSQSLMKSQNCEEIEKEYFFSMPKGYRLSKYLYGASGNIFYYYNQLYMHKLEENKISTGTCTPFSKKLFVTADGKILPCERINYDLEVGYINDDYVELDYKKVADLHNSFLSKCSQQCIHCATNHFCPQCVYQIDDIKSKFPNCSYFKTPEMYDKEKENYYDYLRQHPQYYEKILNEINFVI